jgi:hypothetical protein
LQRELSLKLNNANGAPGYSPVGSKGSLPHKRGESRTIVLLLGSRRSFSVRELAAVFEFEEEKRLTKNEAIVLS